MIRRTGMYESAYHSSLLNCTGTHKCCGTATDMIRTSSAEFGGEEVDCANGTHAICEVNGNR